MPFPAATHAQRSSVEGDRAQHKFVLRRVLPG